jgi:TetR/AcrR family transcriptional repressor of nem operon
MARIKTFNRDAVLTKAMETFWLYGYEKSSMQMLVQKMGINRASLYHTFGNKRSLFLDAIAHYNETVVQPILEPLERPNASKQAIIDFFEYRVELALKDSRDRGCLLVNSLLELAPSDSEMAAFITPYLLRLQNAFQQAVQTAQSQQEISDRLPADAIAHFLINSLQGLCVTFKLNPNRDVLHGIARVILAVLD